jgi:hypothetical protein
VGIATCAETVLLKRSAVEESMEILKVEVLALPSIIVDEYLGKVMLANDFTRPFAGKAPVTPVPG